MHKVVLLALISFPIFAIGQSIVRVSSQQCVWRAGDDPQWAAPSLDESEWSPFEQWKLQPDQPRIWIRCHTDFSSLASTPDPAIQVTLFGAYQLFVNGIPIGRAGNLHSGNFSMDLMRSFPLPRDQLRVQSTRIALRIIFRYFGPFSQQEVPAPEIVAGAPEVLVGRRASAIVSHSAPRLVEAVWYCVVGVMGIMLLGLYLYDRSRKALLYLSLYSVAIAAIRVGTFCSDAQVDFSSTLNALIWCFGAGGGAILRVLFFFEVARRRMPFAFKIFAGVGVLRCVWPLVEIFLPAGPALRLDAMRIEWVEGVSIVALFLTGLAPFVAFWPWRETAPRMRPVAILSMVWGVTTLSFFSVQVTFVNIPGIPNLFRHWRGGLGEMQATMTATVVAALAALLFREQRNAVEERAVLAGEMQAAQQVQRMLAPATIEAAQGLRIDVAFHPMREVGGDFYHCRILPDGRQRVLVGDVSGKGTAAAMTATLLIGAAERRDHDSPSDLLRHLNLVLCESHVGGFTTCLCIDLTSSGTVQLANAGHLPPYRDGDEVHFEAGIPLGITPAAEFRETILHIDACDTLTLLSDGVVEARNKAGELFGFERTAALSRQSAAEIAHAAQQFGQQDDITVLTVSFVPQPSLETCR
jgi:hypothetical protein